MSQEFPKNLASSLRAVRGVAGNRAIFHHFSFLSVQVLQKALPCKLPPSHSFFSPFFLSSLFPLFTP